MGYLDFDISYNARALPAWEASRTLRSITHLYYCTLLAQNEQYTRRLNTVYAENRSVLPEDLTQKLNITEGDQLFLSVESILRRLRIRVYSKNDKAARNVSDAIQEAKN